MKEMANADMELQKARLLSLASEFGFQTDIACQCLQELANLYGDEGQDFLTVEHCGDEYLAKLADATQAEEDWDTQVPTLENNVNEEWMINCELDGGNHEDFGGEEADRKQDELEDEVKEDESEDQDDSTTEADTSDEDYLNEVEVLGRKNSSQRSTFVRDSSDSDDVMIIDKPISTSKRNVMAGNATQDGLKDPVDAQESSGISMNDTQIINQLECMDDFELVNLAVFGHQQFRSFQRKACESTMKGIDCFILMPTGGGKSLCYQLPAVLSPGVTVVVCPLLSLIQDQVLALVNRFDIPATFLSSQQSSSQSWAVIQELRKPRPSCKLLYVTPEKILESASFQTLLKSLQQRETGSLCRDNWLDLWSMRLIV